MPSLGFHQEEVASREDFHQGDLRRGHKDRNAQSDVVTAIRRLAYLLISPLLECRI